MVVVPVPPVTGAVAWSARVGDPVPAALLPCGDIAPTAGITGGRKPGAAPASLLSSSGWAGSSAAGYDESGSGTGPDLNRAASEICPRVHRQPERCPVV